MCTNIKNISSRINNILVPIGFVRSGMVWNRADADFIDVIDIQKDSRSNEFTINAGVCHESLRRMLGFSEFSGFVNEYDCIVRSRCGTLIDGKDRWWKFGEECAHEEALDILQKVVIPFVESMHEEAAMEDFLIGKFGKRKRFPFPECFYLFGLQIRRGEISSALDFLREIERTALGDWKLEAQQLIHWYDL